ncbi:hypothetical protein ORI20_13855 [Mycobacterium sp. CVI_P3]|uniref:Uncharacterized protein n=1 Tax=Mycobacterium pinniadriaticum TaxID=2994102 RepID=A0ABT3SE43_9MYCO|nr:hypothetical protein [Mycobacterium pinniadriaticum]MCX2931364.1 hypothetical protein [Mycobacterium pinniadriaticum]MCX2937788.1 hypothetical protein [Mycobacterium pinniadriaticum]
MTAYRSLYFGPRDVWYRFLAGLPITLQNFLDDQSLWITVPTTRWDLARFNAATDAPVTPCAWWCEKPAGHDWEDLWSNGFIRYHRWHCDVAPYHAIAVEEIEQHSRAGTIRERHVVLDVEAPTDWDVETAERGAFALSWAIWLAKQDVVDAGEVR